MAEQMVQSRLIHWVEPNRGKTPPLHIANRGERYSTVTGVAWINDFMFVANHRSGLRLGLFDLRKGSEPVAGAMLPCLSDDIAVKQSSNFDFEIAVSGCWDCAYALMKLSLRNEEAPAFETVSTVRFSEKTFSHGVEYGPDGRLWLAYSSGERPRIQVGGDFWQLPEPWGARDVCFDPVSGDAFVVAGSTPPKLKAYNQVKTSIWKLNVDTQCWSKIWEIDHVHADACRIYNDTFWFTDQLNDRVIGVDLTGGKQTKAIQSRSLDFPHGLCISSQGVMAVTNYGGSSVALFDISNI